MKLSKLIIITFMVLVLSAVGGYLLMGRQDDEGDPITTVEAKTDADLSLEEIHYVETKGERTEWELWAKSAQYFLDDDYTHLRDLTVTFYPEEGRTVTLRGENGSMKGKKEIKVWGNVVVNSSDGYRVLTDSLRYDEDRRQISTSDPVIIEGKRLRVKGVGAVVDLNEETLSILRDVETVLEG